MQACPLAQVQSTKTFPARAITGKPFQVVLGGKWLDPKLDRVLLVPESFKCGSTASEAHLGGASCSYNVFDQDSQTEIWCGDGMNSIIMGKAQKMRVCFCDAGAKLIRNIDGSGVML